MSTPLHFRIPEAADHLRIGKTMLYDLIAKGRIHVVKIGTRSVITARELERFSASLEAEPPQKPKRKRA
jgi:excisionase family DNA binding protein